MMKTKVFAILRTPGARVLFFGLATRACLVFLAYLTYATSANKNVLNLNIDPKYLREAAAPFGYADVSWYMDIAQNGYEHRAFALDRHSNWNFYPLWPALLRLCNRLFSEMLLSGIILSNLFFLAAMVLLFKLIRLDFEDQTAMDTAILCMIFPAAYFFSRPGPESLFLFLVVAALLCARKGQWLLAGMLGALASLARLQGAVLLLPLLYIYFRQYRKTGNHRAGVLGLLLIPTALLGFMVYMYQLTGNPFANLAEQKVWDNGLAFPLTAVARFFLHPHLISFYGWDLALVSFLFVLPSLILTAVMAIDRRIPREYIIYTAVSLFFIVSRGNLNGSLRYLLTIFPLFLLLALYLQNRKVAFNLVFYLFTSLQIFYFLSFIQFFNWAAT